MPTMCSTTCKSCAHITLQVYLLAEHHIKNELKCDSFSMKQAPSTCQLSMIVHTHSPLANPRGLKEAVGTTVLVESMKFREAQNIPERMLLRSFQALSTLDEGKISIMIDHFLRNTVLNCRRAANFQGSLSH